MISFRSLSARVLIGAVCVLASHLASAADFKAGQITVGSPYARSTAVGQSVGSAYLSLKNGGVSDKLLSASTPVAEMVEIHSMSMDGNVMRMRQLEAVDLPTAQTVELKPGGLHMMLMGLKGPLKSGSSFEMTLVFEKAGTAKVQVKVQAPGAAH